MSVKAKLSLVIGVLSLFILILAVRDLMGNMERVNALDLVEQIDEVSIKLLKAQGSSAVERGTTNGFLGNPAAAKDATISTAKAKRGEAKQALQDAMDLIRRYGFTESSAVRSALGVVETSQSTVDGLRTAADGAFASRSLDGTGDLSSVWFGTTSAAIVDMHKLQQSIEALIPKVASTKIVDTFVVRVATWEMSEHSGRIRGFFAKLISQGAPLNPQAALIQGQNNGHVETGWDTVQGYYPIMPPRIQRAIESIETVFFGEYEPVRKSIILAATSGQPYPMESSEWFAAATKGIAAVLAAQVEISEGLKDLIHEDRNAATTDVFISAVILVAALIIAGFSMFVVFGRIAQPLSHMTEVLSALADGEADVHLADNSGNDEIGKMSRAVHALRGTVVDAFQKGQMLEQLSANVMMASLPDFEITYVNAASKRLLERIEDYLPVPANQVAGQSIDIFHKNPGHVQSLLRDPGNLPYTTRIAIGPEHIQLSLSPIRDRKGDYTGALLTWGLITEEVEMAHTFEQDVTSVVGTVSEATERIHTSAESTAQRQESGASSSMKVANAASETNDRVKHLVTSVEELTASIGEISKRVADAASVSSNAVTDVDMAADEIRRLSDAVAEIGQVVQLINGIASQTNLLALNATIEAARAGEAGKGFAVVASEVKVLANQTTQATEQIVDRINNIESQTRTAVGSFDRVRSVIDEVRDISTAIAGAIEEQSAVTRDIQDNVSGVANDAENVAHSIGGVTMGAIRSGAGAIDVLWSAEELRDAVALLSSSSSTFLNKIKG